MKAVWHRICAGHWPTCWVPETGKCWFCTMRWNPEKKWWEDKP